MQTKDKLDIIFEMQKELNDDIITKRNLHFTKEEWLQKQTLAMLSELAELLDEVNFKWWKNKKELNEENIKEEIIDILHFFVSMCLFADMSADEVFEIYLKKNKENFDRQRGLSKKEGYALNISTDIGVKK